MPKTFDRDLKRILEAAECHFLRQGKGSHEIWWSPITRISITVPTNIESRHTANGVLKQAGLPKAF